MWVLEEEKDKLSDELIRITSVKISIKLDNKNEIAPLDTISSVQKQTISLQRTKATEDLLESIKNNKCILDSR